MIRKLNLIIIMFIAMLLMSLPLHAQRGRGGFGGRGSGPRSGIGIGGLGSLILSIFGGSSYTTDDFTPAAKSHGILQIKVTKKEAEIYKDAKIYVDGRFIGLVRDFKESAIVSVPLGYHVLEFRYNGSSDPANVYVTRGRTTSVVYSFNIYETK